MLKNKNIVTTFTAIMMALFAFNASAQTHRKRTPAKRPVASPRTQPAAATAYAGVTTPTGLTYLITHHGTGRQPKVGETVVVHYTGTLTNGVKFDSSRDRGEPIAFKLGAGQVIKGWDEGIAKLHIGDQAILVIPSQLGYGPRGAGDGLIPPDAALIFIVELVDIKGASASDTISRTLDEKGIDAAISQYRDMRAKGFGDVYTSESDLNGLGYRLLRKNRYKEAIEIFKLNVETYPASANVYDSLGEAYAFGGDKKSAIASYRRALELDPRMESSKAALKNLGVE
jgi:peptidylprolyl isomerase